jgi:peptidoglycan/LPS O-acetylase OafA/YrhL
MRYRREIDGLRAVAVIPVVFFHAGLSVFSGGFIGVDVFFVISGYLITAILLEELRTGKFSVGRFYERRARRILPALFVVMLVSIPLALMLMLPPQLKDFGQSLVAVSLFASNILSWLESGYFEAASELKPLLHTWSLAVEEQFYVIFPLLLMALWRWTRILLLPVITALALASLAMCIVGAIASPHGNFYLPHVRAWELLAGSILAVSRIDRTHKPNDALAVVGLGLIVVAVLLLDSETPYPSAYTLLPVIGCWLVIAFATSESGPGRLLASKPLVWIGMLSYSAYLWHQPLFAFARLAAGEVEPHWLAMAGLVGVTFSLAYLTWRFIEEPFRRRSIPWFAERSQVLAVSFAAALMFVAIGSAGHLTDGFRPLWTNVHSDLNYGFLRIERAQSEELSQDDGECRFNKAVLDEKLKRRIRECRRKYGAGIGVLGDSHAIDLFGVITSRDDSGPFVVGLISGGCRPHDKTVGCQYDAFADLIADEPGMFEFVLFEQAGFYLLSEDGYSPGSRDLFAKIPLTSALPDYQINPKYLDAVVGYLEGINERTPVVWFGPRLEPHTPLRRTLQADCSAEFGLRSNSIEVHSRLESEIRNRLSKSRIVYLSQSESLKIRFPHDFWNCRDIFWSDGDHYSAAGERHFGARADIVELARIELRQYSLK